MAIHYRSAVDAGLTEGDVCSLECHYGAPGISESDRIALHYADLSATNHLAIDDQTFDHLREFFSEREIVELGIFVAWFIGSGRMSATWDMTEHLPEGYQGRKDQPVAPWANPSSCAVERTGRIEGSQIDQVDMDYLLDYFLSRFRPTFSSPGRI